VFEIVLEHNKKPFDIKIGLIKEEIYFVDNTIELWRGVVFGVKDQLEENVTIDQAEKQLKKFPLFNFYQVPSH
jgi:hypothetical protein